MGGIQRPVSPPRRYCLQFEGSQELSAAVLHRLITSLILYTKRKGIFVHNRIKKNPPGRRSQVSQSRPRETVLAVPWDSRLLAVIPVCVTNETPSPVLHSSGSASHFCACGVTGTSHTLPSPPAPESAVASSRFTIPSPSLAPVCCTLPTPPAGPGAGANGIGPVELQTGNSFLPCPCACSVGVKGGLEPGA